MESILLNSGQTALIGSNKDIVELVAEHCSYELARLIEGKIEEVDSEKLYAEERALTDCNYYESELENYSCILHDAMSDLAELEEYIKEAKKIDREKIYQKIRDVLSELRNTL